jgi:hypothetical protein
MQFTSNELYDLLNRPGPLWLAYADLSGANLSAATPIGAKLLGANLSGANLQEAKYDKDTKWPDGFDPVAAGAIKV